MKKEKMVELTTTIPKKPTAEISEVHALMDVMRAIKVKETILNKKEKKIVVGKNQKKEF